MKNTDFTIANLNKDESVGSTYLESFSFLNIDEMLFNELCWFFTVIVQSTEVQSEGTHIFLSLLVATVDTLSTWNMKNS